MRRKIFIIAEAGVNHNGDLKLAKRLVDAAASAGADAVKFQTFQAEALAIKEAPIADYQKKAAIAKNQQDMLKKLELSHDAHKHLLAYCLKKGILFLSSPFDLESVQFLNKLGIKIFKIPSGEITNYPYLIQVARARRPVIMSTGMANMKEIGEAINLLIREGIKKEKLILLHATSAYPTPFEDVNLRAMMALKKRFGVSVGLSDHTPGTEVPLAAVAMGAEVIEKHLTIDKNLPGPDHKASLDKEEFRDLVKRIRHIELAIGENKKLVAPSEAANKTIARKSIVAAKLIRRGDKFSEYNLTTKRPGDGLSPMYWPHIIGRIAGRDFKMDEKIEVRGLRANDG